ncbi:MAG: PLP-dependent transferase, partial [Haemophilus parainfluenzae]|nr:PLP-dependent transferase [Haemophilus parainfluenzae]
KYLVGHSDIMIGTAVANTRTWDKLREHSYLMGQMVDADSAYTTARGIRTLGVRLKQHHESSLKVAKWLSEQPQVKAVYHPALPSCPGHKNFKRDFTGASGLFSFELHKRLSDEELSAFMDNFDLFTMAYSWGGFESLILCNQPEEIAKIRPGIERKLTGSLIRVHIGFEDTDELIADLQAGFDRIK